MGYFPTLLEYRYEIFNFIFSNLLVATSTLKASKGVAEIFIIVDNDLALYSIT